MNNSISFRRINSDEDVFIFIGTDKGPINKLIYGLPSGFNKDFPVGTIITSYLVIAEIAKEYSCRTKAIHADFSLSVLR